jgi:hypothetical protein
MKVFYKNPIILILILVSYTSISQSYTRGLKNWRFEGDFGLSSTEQKTHLQPLGSGGHSWSISFGKYISGRKFGVLPLSVNLAFQRSESYVLSEYNDRIFVESELELPIKYDLQLFSLAMSKSNRYECRSLTNTLILGIVPGYALKPEADVSKMNWSFDLAYAFNLSKSGGSRDIQAKDSYLSFFWRHDMLPRYNNFLRGEYFKSIFGLRLQYTWFKTHKFSNM